MFEYAYRSSFSLRQVGFLVCLIAQSADKSSSSRLRLCELTFLIICIYPVPLYYRREENLCRTLLLMNNTLKKTAVECGGGEGGNISNWKTVDGSLKEELRWQFRRGIEEGENEMDALRRKVKEETV